MWITGVVTVSILVIALLNLFFTDISRAKDVVGIFQSFVTGVAIAFGGLFAVFKLQVFRDFEPHLTISNSVSHRIVGTKHVHIAVIATLHNSSRVEVKPNKGIFRLQQVSPTSDKEIDKLQREVFEDQEYQYIQWPTIDEIEWTPDSGVVSVEPGESHYEAREFIVPAGVRTVIVYTYFYNPKYSEHSESARGWHAITTYDIIRKV